MFKIGDRVRRVVTGMFVPEACKDIVKGDEYIVSESRGGVIELKGFGNFTFNAQNFELVKESVVETSKKTPHKHAELIKAWADGAIIQYRYSGGWGDVSYNKPSWREEETYRIKPEPDVVLYAEADVRANVIHSHSVLYQVDNLKLTFDGETGKLKKAEVIA